MAVSKLSQIPAAGSNLGSSDFLIAVQSGTTDVLFTAANVFAFANLLVSSNTLSMINPASGTTAQSFHIYNTFTNGSNYERGVFDWGTNSNELTLGVQVLGSGTARNMRIQIPGTQILFWTSNGPYSSVSDGVPGFLLNNGAFIGWASGNIIGASADTLLGRGAAGILKFASSQSFTANSTTATVLGSLGPAGASTTVTKWLTIVDNGGTTRYIPCF